MHHCTSYRQRRCPLSVIQQTVWHRRRPNPKFSPHEEHKAQLAVAATEQCHAVKGGVFFRPYP
eukprot:scaffold6412_cov147-Skeletonema_dohrnii-CCMP3373.AAC.5